MHCQEHPEVTAKRSCHACMKPLCQECSHEVISSFFCADCLHARLTVGRATPKSSWVKLPWFAGLLSCVMPGLGQVYNGLVMRGLSNFVILLLIIQLGPVVGDFVVFVVLGAIGYYFWQVVDAVATARDINRLGHVPDPDEAKAMGRGPIPGAAGGSRGLGFVLVAIGALFFLNNTGLADFVGDAIDTFWPLAFIVAGFWLLRKGRRERDAARRAELLDLQAATIDAQDWQPEQEQGQEQRA